MKSNSRSAFYWVAWTAFLVITLLGIANSQLDRIVSQLGIETIAPANLHFSHQILESRLRVEDRNFPIDQLTSSSAYREHLTKLAAYTEKLEIHRSNDRIRSLGLTTASLIAAVAMLSASFLTMRRH